MFCLWHAIIKKKKKKIKLNLVFSLSEFKFSTNPGIYLNQPLNHLAQAVDNDENKQPNFPTKVISILDLIHILITLKDV